MEKFENIINVYWENFILRNSKNNQHIFINDMDKCIKELNDLYKNQKIIINDKNYKNNKKVKIKIKIEKKNSCVLKINKIAEESLINSIYNYFESI